MMTKPVTHRWVCSDCHAAIDLTLRIERREGRHIALIDDIDVRAHIAMHEFCTCEWTDSEIRDGDENIIRTVRSRRPADGCPIHGGH